MTTLDEAHKNGNAWLKFIRFLNAVCFSIYFAMFVGVDLNGQFLDINERITWIITVVSVAMGFVASCIMFRFIPKERLIAVLLMLFYGFGIYNLGRVLMRR